MIERIVDAAQEEEGEEQTQQSLRPTSFKTYIGQRALKDNLQLAIRAATKRGEPIDHVLLYGPPGLGKTTMAGVIAAELGTGLRVTSGPAIERTGDLAAILTSLSDGDVLFIDEIHRLSKTVEEVLIQLWEDFGLDVIIGKGPGSKSIRLDLPHFTIIGATTRAGALSAPLRDRFGHVHRLEFYSPTEMEEILQRSAGILGIGLDGAAASELAARSRLTPRIANRLLKRVRDYAQVHGDGSVNLELAVQALHLLDRLGWSRPIRPPILTAIIEHYAGGPVGVETLAAICHEERATIEDVYEPYLMQIGYLERTSRGRKVTPKAYLHLGVEPPASQPTLI